MIRLILFSFALTSAISAFAQRATPGEAPFAPVSEADEPAWEPTHPDGDTPHERMLVLAHTDVLPEFDRAEIYAVSFPDRNSGNSPKREPGEKTFPVRPYRRHADVHAKKTIKGKTCDELRAAWKGLTFDSLGGAFCHYPRYGLRLYRDNDLLFETTICWQCQNFSIPTHAPDAQPANHRWYGFANDRHAQTLRQFLEGLLPHPKRAANGSQDDQSEGI